MKCHRCEKEVEKAWYRGSLVFCSSECREESKNEGEPIPDPVQADFIYVDGRWCIPG